MLYDILKVQTKPALWRFIWSTSNGYKNSISSPVGWNGLWLKAKMITNLPTNLVGS